MIMGYAYVTVLLQIGEGETVDRYNRLLLNDLIREYKKYIRSYRVIQRDPKDQVIASESGSGLQFIPNVIIEVRTDFPEADTILNAIKSELFRRLDVRNIGYLGVY